MSQTIEEIAEILRTLKLDTDISSDEIQKRLAVVMEKIETIADDVEANAALKDYLIELRNEINNHYESNQVKYEEFGQAFRYISSNQELNAKATDIDSLIQKVEDNLENLEKSFLEKNSENLRSIVSEINSVNSSIVKVSDDVSERISFNFDTTRDLIENISQEISRQHAQMQSERQSADDKNTQNFGALADDIRVLGENLVVQSSNYRELIEMRTADIKDYINSNGAALASAQAASENKLSEKLAAIENLNHGFEANIIDVNNSLQSIIQNIMSMDPTVQNDIIKKELETIYLATNGILSSLQIFDQKNDELARAVAQLMTRENFDFAQQKIEDIIDRVNDIDSHISEISLSLDFDTISSKIDGLAYVMDNVKTMMQDIGEYDNVAHSLQQLDQKLSAVITEEDFNAFRADLTDFIKKIVDNSNFLNNDLVENKEKIEQILKSLQSLDFMDKLNSIAGSIDAISNDNLNTVKNGLGELSAKLDDVSFDFHQKASENADLINSAISVVSTKLDFVNNYLANDVPANFNEIKGLSEQLKDFISEVTDAYKSEGVVLEDKISAKLFELQKNFSENAERYISKLSEIKDGTENFNQEVVEVLSGKTDDLMQALEPIKNGIKAITENDFSDNLIELKEQLSQVYANVNSQMQMTLGQSQTLSEGLEKIYSETIDKINGMDQVFSSQAQGNLEAIRTIADEIGKNLENNLNENSQIMSEWKSILVNIDGKINEINENCGTLLSSVAVDVTNALNAKLESVLEDLKSHIGAPVSANDLMWSVDTLKSELSTKLGELESRQSSKDDDVDAKEEILLILNQLGVKVEELGIRYSNDEFNEILGNSRMQIMSGLKDLKNIILIAMKEVAKSSTASMDVLHEKVDTLLEKGADVELHEKVSGIDSKAVEILEKLENLPSGSGENTEALISLNSKVDNLSEKAEKNAQIIQEFQEQFNTLGSTDEQIANSLMNVAEKFSGLRQNAEQLSQELASVNETVETINIRGEGVSNAISEISDKTSEVAQKSEELAQSVAAISDKVDTFAAVDEQITQALDLISNKIDDASNNEQITQGMQYLNEKMDLANESDDRISRTIDVVLDKIETFSVSDDEINQSLNNISDKVEILGNNSEKVVDSIDELTNKVEAFGMTDERVIETMDTLTQKIEAVGEESERSKDLINSISDKIEIVGDSADKISEKMDILSEKVDAFSDTDDRIARALDNVSEKSDVITLNIEKNGQAVDDINSKIENISSNNEKIAEAFEQLKENVSSVGDVFASSVDAVSSKFTDTAQLMLNGLDVLSDNAKENKAEILDNISTINNSIVENGQNIQNNLADNFAQQEQIIKSSLLAVNEKLSDDDKIDKVTQKLENLEKQLSGVLSDADFEKLENALRIAEKKLDMDRSGILKGVPLDIRMAKPLIIIDGSAVDSLPQSVSPEDISSVIVSDPGSKSASEYGDRGKNGVIEIRTRNAADVSTVRPLFIVDGKEVPYEEFSALDAEQFKSITVYKNPEDTKKYTDNPGQGVIVVVTKGK